MNESLITSDPNLMTGKPVVRGTRITVALILEKLAAGEMMEQLTEAHPRLTEDAIRATMAHAARAERAEVEERFAPITPSRLITELHRLGIRHLATATPPPAGDPLPPRSLVFSLAACPDARVRSALVPLFLLRPAYASAAQTASTTLSGQARIYLLCCYSAAVALAHLLADALRAAGRPAAPPLPDLFATELGLAASARPHQRLDDVSRRHAELSGENINWRGTYEHAAAAALRCVAPETAWNR